MKRKVGSILVVLVLALSLAVHVFAAEPRAQVGVDLTGRQFHVYSAEVAGTYCRHAGSNASNSLGSVWFVPEYKDGSLWFEDASKRLVEPGDAYASAETFVFANIKTWHLELDAWGPLLGCTASGYIGAST